MATNPKPTRRNDVIHCENCGEDYSVTYKRCPFCDERPGKNGRPKTTPGGRRVAGGAGRGSGRPVNPLQIAGLVITLVLIIAAMYIVFSSLAPLFEKGGEKPGSASTGNASASQSAPGTSTSQPDASVADDPEPPPPVAAVVNSLTLSTNDFTLRANESYRITATVDPADAEITWTSSDETLATVGADGTVTNVNAGSSKQTAVITAAAGDKTVECLVRCNGGSSGSAVTPGTTTPGTTTPSGGGTASPGSTGTVTGAGSGLNVRSGPGSSNPAIASILNGNTVTILEDMGNGWYRITFIGSGGQPTEGYVSKNFIAVN